MYTIKELNKKDLKNCLSTGKFIVKTRIIALASCLTLSGIAFASIVGCSKKTSEEETQSTITTLNNSLEEQLAGNVEPGSVKTFDVGQHVISVRVYYMHNYDGITYTVNNTPEGYEVFDVDPVTIKNGYGSSTGGFDIWFKNTEPVEVEASYNEIFNNYGYYTLGKVVEKEEVLEK